MSKEYIIRGPKPFYDIPDISVAELVNNLLKQLKGETTCIIDANNGLKLTIEELITKSNCIAMALLKKGIMKSDIVLTFAENSIELVIVLFAAMFLGLTLYPISPIANVHELDQLFDTLGSMAIFVSQTKADIIEKIVVNNDKKRKLNIKFIGVIDGFYANYNTFEQLLNETINRNLVKIPYFSVKPKKDLFILLQSSGTSGVPKSVMISHKAFVATIMSMTNTDIDKSQFSEQPVFCHMTPFGCMSGISVLFGQISLGSALVIYKEYNEQLILKSVEKYRINLMSFVPAFGHKLIYGDLMDKYDLSSLQFMITAGAAFPANVAKDIIDKYNVIIQEVYGMTEYGALTLCPDMEIIEFISGNLGRPAHNTQIKVIDSTGNSLGPNIDGEVCVKGPKMFSGYLNNVLATNEAIDSDGWFRTGDIGHYDQKNRIFLTDRLKELIKFGTKQVSPTELELFLLTHKCVAEVAVVGVRHETQTQWPRAYVKLKHDMSATEQEIQKYISDSLSDSKQLRAGVVFVDDILRTTVGKVDKRYYKQLVVNELIRD